MSFPARWRVLKFGGTSVADPSAWPLIARTVRQHCREGARPLLVCSAFSKVTDLLVSLCSELRSGACPEATVAALRARHEDRAQALGLQLSDVPEAVALLDRIASIAQAAASDATLLTPALEAELLAMGERLSTLVGAAWLNANGLRAHWLDARRVLQLDTDAGQPETDSYLAAEVVSDLREDLSAELAALETDVIITQGFIAQNDTGETVVLGRGGSDTAASAIAATLGAELVEIWTDVPGVLTTDPRLTPRARLIEELTLETMEAMAGRGAKVLHPRCLAPVRRAGIPLAIRWTRHPDIGCGTALVAGATHTQRPGAAAVTVKRNVVAFSLDRERHWQPVGFLAEVSSCLSCSSRGVNNAEAASACSVSLAGSSSPALTSCTLFSWQSSWISRPISSTTSGRAASTSHIAVGRSASRAIMLSIRTLPCLLVAPSPCRFKAERRGREQL